MLKRFIFVAAVFSILMIISFRTQNVEGQQLSETRSIRFNSNDTCTVIGTDTLFSDRFDVRAYNSIQYRVDLIGDSGDVKIQFWASMTDDSSTYKYITDVISSVSDTGWSAVKSILTPNCRNGKLAVIGNANNDTLRFSKIYRNGTPIKN